MQSIRILSTRVDDISLKDALSLASSFLSDGSQHQIITANSIMLLETQSNDNLKNVFEEASLVIPESAGVLWAAGFLSRPLKEKIPGIDFMVFLLEQAQQKNYSVFFLGAEEGIIKKAVEQIRNKFPKLKIAGFHNGFFSGSEEELIQQIKLSNADIIFAGLSLPFQEIWLNKNLLQLGVKMAMGVGGSFDVLSGNLKRAPKWMIALNAEWIFRIFQQPRRIVRVIKLLDFTLRVIREKTVAVFC